MSEPDQNVNDAAFEQATQLGEEGERLALAGRYREAVPVLSEAVRLHRSITGAHPALIGVVAALNNLGFCLSRLKQYEAATRVLREAWQLCEPMAKAAPSVLIVRDFMAKISSTLGFSLAMLGEFEAAVEATRDLIEHRRALFEPGPLPVDFDLGKDLRLFALARARVGVEGERANAAIHEAVVIFQRLAQSEPAQYGRELLTTFDVLAEVLDVVGRVDDAKVVRRHLVSEYEAQARAMEQSGRAQEAAAIRSYSATLAAKA